MTRCNIRNGTQNEIKRHCGPQRARSNPRYGNLKGKNANSPPHRHLLNPIIAGSQQPARLPPREGGLWASGAIPTVQVAIHLSLCATGPVEPSWPWPHGRDPMGTALLGSTHSPTQLIAHILHPSNPSPMCSTHPSPTFCTHPTQNLRPAHHPSPTS